MSRRGAILQDYGGRFEPQSTEAQRDAANYYQRDKEQDKDLNYRKQAAKQKEGADSTKFITELENKKTGVNDIDIENDKQLLAAQNKMIEMQQKGAPLSEIQIYAMRELPKINNAYTLGKNYKAQVEKGMTDLEKKYGNGVDLNAVQSKAYKMMADDIFDKDERGNNKGYKDPSLIPKNRDYIAEIENDSQSLGTVFKPSGAFEKNMQTTKLIPVKGGFSVTDKYGKKQKKVYSGNGTIYDEPIFNEDNEQTGWDVKGEAVPLGKNQDGTVIIERVVPKDQFDIALSTPAAKKDFDIKFNEYLNESGVNPDKLDARAKDVLERKFMYDLFKKTNIHGSSFDVMDEQKEAPIKNITNINNRTGSDVDINDLYGRIDKKATENRDGGKGNLTRINSLALDEQNVVIDFANKGRGEDALIDRNNMFIKKEDNGDVNIYKVSGEDKEGKQIFLTDAANLIGTLPKVGTNLKVQANTKAKAAVVAQGEANRTKKTEAKKFNVIDPTTGKVVMEGVDEDAANKAKAKGYKIQ